MAQSSSFDITTGADLQEVDNAVNQAMKEVGQRYDFKGTHCTIVLDRATPELRLEADDDFRMKALFDVLQGRLIKRAVPVRNLTVGEIEPAAGGRVRRTIGIRQGIDADTGREIVKAIKSQGFKKVQAQIQADQVRVSSPSKDDLQAVIQFLRAGDFGVELGFGNFR
ncbi:MAG: YajQ family cyclic di-GMP-binding protein [Candidatus Palauibacterales bacterium]|nr:YajQ family cyclic di-GMP-binding protein [Candidatus Palauibacterales bacterium]